VSECPHPYEAMSHGFQAARGDRTVCQVCGGRVRACAGCGALNRAASNFCVQCGRPVPHRRMVARLLAPKLLRDGIEAAIGRPMMLSHLLQLGTDESALLWRGAAAGAFVFSRREAGGPMRLHLVDPHVFYGGRARALCERLPAAETWLCEPVISEQGVFVASMQGVTALRAHGGEEPYEQVCWQPPPGTILRAAARDADGGLLLLASEGDDRAVLLAGNGQDEEWHPLASLPLSLPADTGAWIGVIPGTGTVWLAANKRMMLVDRAKRELVAQQAFGDIGMVEPLWHRRHRQGQFEPIVLAAGEDHAPVLVLAVAEGTGSAVLQARIGDGTPARAVARMGSRGWAAADAAGTGFLLEDENGIGLFVDGRRRWRLETDAESELPPVLARDWLCVVTGRRGMAALTADRGTEVTFYQRHAAEDMPPQRHVGMPVAGRPNRGFPPLLVGGTMVVATQAADGRDFRFYPVEVAELAEAGE